MRYVFLLVILFSGCCFYRPYSRPYGCDECPPVIIQGMEPVIPGDPSYLPR
jgi:hypothetical protein